MKQYASIIKLAGLLVLAPVVIYVLSVSDTIGLYKEYRQAGESSVTSPIIARTEDFSASAPMLSSGVLMRIISGICTESKVTVGSFSPEEVGREGDLRLVSAQLCLTGDFVGLLKVLARVEEINDIKISGAEFSTMKVGNKDKTIQLELTVVQVEDHKF